MIVYIATNAVNGYEYIGVTIRSLSLRRQEHHWAVNAGSKLPFHCAIRKYGRDAFIWREVFIGSCQDDILAEEIRLIKERKPKYNVSYGGYAGGTFLGCKHSDEAKEKMRLKKLGRKHTEEHKAKIAASGRGRVFTEEVRKKIRESNLGQKRTEEARRKMSESRRRYNHPPESYAKMAETNRGKKRNEEQKQRIAEGIRTYWAKKKAMG